MSLIKVKVDTIKQMHWYFDMIFMMIIAVNDDDLAGFNH